MAADNSPPRMKPIAITALVAVVALFGLKFLFASYYTMMFEAEEYRKVGGVAPTELLALHAAEKKRLASGPIPIDRAMVLVAKGRDEPIAGLPEGGITAEPSTDTASLVGWAQLAKPGAAAAAATAAASAMAVGSATPASSSSAAPMPSPSGSASPSPAPVASSPSPATPHAAPPSSNSLSSSKRAPSPQPPHS